MGRIIKKGDILYAEYGMGYDKFVIIDTNGKDWIAKMSYLPLFITNKEDRDTWFTGDNKKWWQLWK